MSSILFHIGTHSHNRAVPQGGYISGKGTGIYSNPVGISTGNIRPLTNNDPSYATTQKYGLPRPIKHYRNGIKSNDTFNQQVKSYTGHNHMVSRMLDYPGGAFFNDNANGNLQTACINCKGVGVVSTYQPSTDLTDNPNKITQTNELCCNAEYKSLQRVLPANTVLKKNYYTTTKAYLYNRCNTFEQRQFNYITSGNNTSLPGSPSAIDNTYRANCNPNFVVLSADTTPENIEVLSNQSQCSPVMYKPNNYNFAKQGAVTASTYILEKSIPNPIIQKSPFVYYCCSL